MFTMFERAVLACLRLLHCSLLAINYSVAANVSAAQFLGVARLLIFLTLTVFSRPGLFIFVRSLGISSSCFEIVFDFCIG